MTINFNSGNLEKLYLVIRSELGKSLDYYIDDMVLNKLPSKVKCLGDAKFYDVNGDELANEQAYVGIKTIVDGVETSAIYENQEVTATIDYDKTSGAYNFLGWYDVNGKLYATTETIEFTATADETYTPYFSSTNLIGDSGSFENIASGTHLRMDAPTTDNPNFPTGNKWGFNVNAGYWGKVWAESITYKDGSTDEQISSGNIRTDRLGNGTCNVLDDASIAKSGSKFLHINEGVPVSLGIDNLDANTDYELSFYLRYKSTTNKIKAIALTTTVNISNATLDKTSFENAVVNPNHKIVFASCDNNQLSKVSTTDWQKISISFNSKNFEKLYLAVVSSGSAGLDYYIDDMVCTKVVKVDVDSYDLRLGTVEKPESNAFIQGSSVTVKATAFEGNKFDGWYVGDKLVCTGETYTFTATENVVLTPKFSGNNYVAYEHFYTNGLDGTFENGDVGSWKFYSTSGANVTWCSATVKTNEHYEGSKSLYLYGPYQYSILKLTNLMPHSRYTLSFKFKLPATYVKNGVETKTNGRIVVVAITTADAINPDNKSQVISSASDIACTGDWQQFELSFISNNDPELNLMLKVDTPADGPQISIDNLNLVVDKEVTHYYAAICDRYCSFCGLERDINVEHTYSNVCDTTCNVCGNTRTVGAHVYDNACDATCNICGAKRTVSNHEYSSNCDTLCDICGAERKVSVAHTYDNDCDDTCNVCYTKRTVGAHVYDNACDTTCNICGATRTVGAHVYDNACDTTCNICGAIREAGAHVYDNACDTTCNICGATRTVGAHVYDNACDTDCNICGATRETKHVYDNACDTTCNICGATRTVGAHVYDNACDTDCNICGATRTVGAHVYDNACDTDCNICGATRTVGDHVYYGACDSTCKICGNERKDTAAHTYTNDCDKSCNVCGATREVGDHVYDNACDTDCNNCGATREVGDHVYETTTTKATLTKNGSIVKKCSVCGNVESTTTIYYPKTVSIAATTYTYTGKVITPAITVKDSNGKALKKGTDYSVSYVTGRKNVGKYRVTVTFKGNYTGTKNFYFTIKPVKTTVSKLTAGTKSIKVAITKKSTQVTGYQIQYATSKTFKSAKTKTVSSYKTTSVTLSKLAAKTTYYVRVRTYTIANGDKYYSGWSTYKYTKTK